MLTQNVLFQNISNDFFFWKVILVVWQSGQFKFISALPTFHHVLLSQPSIRSVRHVHLFICHLRLSHPTVMSDGHICPTRSSVTSVPWGPSVHQVRPSVRSICHVCPSHQTIMSIRHVFPSCQSIMSVGHICPPCPSVTSVCHVCPSQSANLHYSFALAPEVRPIVCTPIFCANGNHTQT